MRREHMKMMKKAVLLAMSLLALSTPITISSNPHQQVNAVTTKSTLSGRYVPNEETVYVTKTGNKYHRSTCRYVKKSKIAMTKSEAQKKGYKACSVCKP